MYVAGSGNVNTRVVRLNLACYLAVRMILQAISPRLATSKVFKASISYASDECLYAILP